MQRPLPNRLAIYVTALGALAAGLLPLVGNLDWESTAGILGAIVAITGVVAVWLYNWGKYERGEGDGLLAGEPDDDLDDLEDYDELDDQFDETTAQPIPPAVAEASHTPDTGTTLEGSPATGSPPRHPEKP